jgi:pimeloyl-ACP methyl ester carboxylesterase
MLLSAGKQLQAGGSKMMFATARGGVRIGYDILGAGQPIVMLHDLGKSSRFWCDYGYVKSCLTEGRQAVLIDLRGHGDSSEPFDASACDPINCSWDVIAVLDHAGIGRADILGYGFGGRVALCTAAWSSDRVHAVAAGSAHPFAERSRLGPGEAAEIRGTPTTEAAPMMGDWPDISEAVVRSGVPVLLFVGEKDPHCPLSLSYGEQSGATVIVLTGRDYVTTAAAPSEFLPKVLEFFESPIDHTWSEHLPRSRWSGSWP